MRRSILVSISAAIFLWGGWAQVGAADYTLSVLVKAGDIIDGRTITDVASFSLNNLDEIVFSAGATGVDMISRVLRLFLW